MADYHIKSTGKLGVGDIYYKGGDSWTTTYADRKKYTNKTTATNRKNQKVTYNGVSYSPVVWSNSTVVTE